MQQVGLTTWDWATLRQRVWGADALKCEARGGGGDSGAGAPFCADTRVDRAHCGACGRACMPFPNLTRACGGGACVPGVCVAGFTDCNGMTVDGCERACTALPNASAMCAAGACTIGACNAGCACNPLSRRNFAGSEQARP